MNIGNTSVPPPHESIPGELPQAAWAFAAPPDPPAPHKEDSDPAVALLDKSTALALLKPALQSALEHLERLQAGVGVFETLMHNVSCMQESFMQALHACIERHGIALTGKLTLHLNEHADLVVSGDCPDAGDITFLLERHPELSALFTEIAIQSATLRDLHNLHTIARYATPEESYAALMARRGESQYQLSLKGEMNHFYFTRPTH